MSVANTLSFICNHPLSRGRRLSNLLQFAKWQVKNRALQGPHVEKFVGSARLMVRRGQRGATGNIYVGLHEFEDMVFVLHVLRSRDLFFDVGANIGSYTVLAAKVAQASVIAIEPVPATYQSLLGNISINDIGSLVDAKNWGLAAQKGELSFTTAQDTMNHVAVDAGRDSADCVTVRVTTFDDLARSRCPFLAKIDVEGYETEVLAGAGDSLANPELCGLIVELNGSGKRYGHSDEEPLTSLVEAGFAPYRYEPFSRTMESLDGPNRGDGNTLFLRDLPFIERRISSAPSVNVRGLSF